MEKGKVKRMGLRKIIIYKQIEGTYSIAEFFEKCIWKSSSWKR